MQQQSINETDVRISVFIGTKAQFIKMVPIIRELDARGWSYRLIDTGQHGALVKEVIKEFGLREPDVRLSETDAGVSTVREGIRWMLRLIGRYLVQGKRARRTVFGDTRGISLVHGDTASTLISALIAKRAGQQVAHVEAGLRSWRYFNPFPEEIVRILVMRMSDVLFSPSSAATRNLKRMGLAKRTHQLSANTSIDVVRHDLAQTPTGLPPIPESYSVATIHRLETLYSKARLQQVVSTVLRAHHRKPVMFVQHPPTSKRLAAAGLDARLREAGVHIVPLLDHVSFLHLLAKASFVISDGGSIQEEAYYLGVPCLVLRDRTERDEGIGQNVLLSEFEDSAADEFLANFENYRRQPALSIVASPSQQIADALKPYSR